MTTALVVGTGAVGSRAAAQLAATPAVERVLLADLDPARAATLAEELGARAEATTWAPGDPFPEGTVVVVCATPGATDVPIATAALSATIPLATCGDSPEGVRRLLELDDVARAAGTTLAVGAGLAPGLSEILVRHAQEALDAVDEVHVARFGVSGQACRRRRRQSARRPGHELDHGAWVPSRPMTGRRLVAFPDPVGARDTRRVASAVPLLARQVVPHATRLSAREALRWQDLLAAVAPRRPKDPLGAVTVEVRGRRGPAAEILTFGAVDRMAAAAGAVLAVAALRVAGLDGAPPPEPGARSPALLAPPATWLAELARRGVRAAAFHPEATD